MPISVYVGNLAFTTAEDGIRSAFASAGFPVRSVLIMRSPQNDRSRGFGFVELDSLDEAEAAIEAMKQATIDGRPLKLGMARERTPSRADGRSFQSYSGLGGSRGPRRPGGGSRRKSR
jgi:RNA recognition motif-containing protein